jgi:hypothetical protein
MAPIESLSITVSRRRLPAFARRDAARTVVWLGGEHDDSTVACLARQAFAISGPAPVSRGRCR